MVFKYGRPNLAIDRIDFTYEVKRKTLLSPPNPIASTPEGAIISKGLSQGIPLRKICGGWVEYDFKTKLWVVYMVIQC